MLETLLVCKGHPYERDPFYAMFDGMADVNWTLVEQPAARALFSTEQAQPYDAFVMYDMPGIQFDPRPGEPPIFETPSERYKERFLSLLEAGQGMVFLHHAIAGWPAWPEYAEIIGGRFLYSPTKLRGDNRPDSGYRHAVTHTISAAAPHPILQGVPEQFQITDELYLFEVFDDSVEPLLVSDYAFESQNFYSATAVVEQGKMFSNEGWSHPAGSNLIGWTKTYGGSRIVYLQCGDDPVAYANPHLQTLSRNAIAWVSHK
jgi:type 1 glutamine amidotransferase